MAVGHTIEFLDCAKTAIYNFPCVFGLESIFHLGPPLGRRGRIWYQVRDRCFFPRRQQNVGHKPAFHRNGT